MRSSSRLRVASTSARMRPMAERLSVQLGRAISADNVRKTLGRAQGKFSELLFEEVASSLEEPTAEELEQELQSLDLLRFCRTAWELRKGKFPCR